MSRRHDDQGSTGERHRVLEAGGSGYLGPVRFRVEGYRDGRRVEVDWEDGLAIGSSRLVDAFLEAAEAELPIEVHPDGRIIRAALEPAETAYATITALLDGIPAATSGDIPELFRDRAHWADVA